MDIIFKYFLVLHILGNFTRQLSIFKSNHTTHHHPDREIQEFRIVPWTGFIKQYFQNVTLRVSSPLR